jgi:hypothetical protein
MSIIKEVLLDAEKKQATDSLLRLWLEQLNDDLHDAEDVFDEIEYQASRKQVVAMHIWKHFYKGTSFLFILYDACISFQTSS